MQAGREKSEEYARTICCTRCLCFIDRIASCLSASWELTPLLLCLNFPHVVSAFLPGALNQVLDDVEPPRRQARDNEEREEGEARTAYLQPSLKADPLARPELERDHDANVDFERYRGRV